MTKLSGGLIAHIYKLMNTSSYVDPVRSEILASLNSMSYNKAQSLILELEMAQLDLTQLSVYSNTDIHKRLDYIESQEKM